MPFKISIIEDEKNISEIVAKYLEKEAIKLIKLNFYFKKKSHPEKKLYDQII